LNPMGAISLRLSDHLERKLGDEARLCGQPRSQLIREALEELLARREHQRFVAELVAAARALAADAEASRESLEMATDFLPAENAALRRAEAAPATAPENVPGFEAWWH